MISKSFKNIKRLFLWKKIVDIIESIAHEKDLNIEDVKNTVCLALTKTAKKIYGEEYEYEAIVNTDTKTLMLFQKVLVVEDNDEKLKNEKENYIGITEAREVDKEIEIDDELTYELKLENLGRTAAATLHKELEFHIQRLLENQIFEKYKNMIGRSIFGAVTRVDGDETTYVEFDEIQAIMPRRNRIKGEKFKAGEVVKAVIRKVFIDKIHGIYVEISRTSPKFLEALLALEVPEI